jgi:hypothetical protein
MGKTKFTLGKFSFPVFLQPTVVRVYAVHDCFKHDIFLLHWRQVLSYDVSLLNIRLVVNSLIDSV